MKKLFLSVSIIFLAATFAQAQSPLPKGAKQFNARVGLSGWGVPVYVGMDFGVHPDISVGGELSFRGHRHRHHGVSYRHSIIGVAANGNYHFNRLLQIPSNWDLYAGLNLGFYSWGGDDHDDDHDHGHSGLDLGAQIGGRYYFTPKVGINLEFGGGLAFGGGKIGISVRF